MVRCMEKNATPSRKTLVINGTSKRQLKAALSEDVVYIGRPSMWGNPFASVYAVPIWHTDVIRVSDPIAAYKEWLDGRKHKGLNQKQRKQVLENVHTLRGKTLLCFCKPKPCHGDVLAEMADRVGDNNEPECE